MRLPLILALLTLSASSYADRTAPLPQDDAPAQEARPEPAPQLMHLERALLQKQEARDKGGLQPEKYQEFIAAFRVELEAVMGRIPPTAENLGLHAQILARLGTQEQGRALASLEQALAQDPESPPLLVAKGSILYEQQDFQAADALALQAWEASGRKSEQAWALHKMSEGRISGVTGGEPAPRLKPASDFARLDWSIPERHDINEQSLDRLRQATKAFRVGDIPAAQMYTQQAMNADPTSKSMQDLYQHAQANFAKRAEIGTALKQAAAAKNAGRHQDALAWMQKAYDLFPNDYAYEALQVARQRAADDAAREKRAAPAASPASQEPEGKKIDSRNFLSGFMHFLGGSAKPRRVSFEDIDTSAAGAADFEEVAAELKKPARDESIRILSSRPWSTSGAQGLLIGNFTLLLKGTPTLHKDCRWSFEGSLRAFDDRYDFNKGTRAWIPEALTAFGRNSPGKSYRLEIRGAKRISESGIMENCP